ncbi:MAG: hypothetical protein RL205_1667 [Actinomycetota bacterium]|jgi:CBS-domain-containing membrane protein
MPYPPTHEDKWRQRVRPVDPASSLPLKRLVPLVLVETAGLAILFGLYQVFHVGSSLLAPLVVPPIVTFVLVFSTAHAKASRPLRVFVAYAIAGFFGLGLAALPGPTFIKAVIAAALTLFFMHLLGAFHAPAVAVSLAAVLGETQWQRCLLAYPILMGIVALVLFMAWAAHRTLGDDSYPDSWW